MSAPDQTPADGAELSLAQVGSIFWRGRWWIAACTALATLCGFLFVQRQGTIWRAQSRLFVQSARGAVPGMEALFGLGAKNYANTQAELLVSTEVLVEALQEFRGAHPRPDLFEPGTNEIAWLKKELDVRVGSDDDVISLGLDSAHKHEACAVVNEIVAAFEAFQTKMQRGSAEELRTALTAEEERRRTELEQATLARANYRAEHPEVGDEVGGLSVLAETWRKLSAELVDAENELRKTAAAWQTAQSLKADPTVLRQVLPTLLEHGGFQNLWPPSVTAIVQQVIQLQRERADLVVQLSAEHPRVVNLDVAIGELRAELTRQDALFAEAFVEGLRQAHLAADNKHRQLAEAVAAREERVNALGAVYARYDQLSGDVLRAEKALDAVYTQLAALRVGDGDDSGAGIVHVLDYAEPRTAEVASSKATRLAIAVLLGLLAGTGLAWLRGMLDQRIRSAEELRGALGLSVLAILPRRPRGSGGESAVEAWGQHAASAEAARSLRTAIYFASPDGEARVTQITSPDTGDGKTTIAGDIAIAMAKAGQRTLLIDADMRRPRQAARFRLAGEDGLSTLLRDDGDLQTAVQRSGIDRLDVLAAGPIPPDPAELLDSPRFAQLLRTAAERYDRVIVDSPPILPVADARIIAARCASAVLVVRVDKTTVKRAAAARDALLETDVRLLGIALNGMPRGIGYGYGAGYGYGRSGGDDQRAKAPGTPAASTLSTSDPVARRRRPRSDVS